FASVTEGLTGIGAVPVLQYLNDGVLVSNVAPVDPPGRQPSSHPPPSIPDLERHVNVPRAVARLHQACQHTFGSTDALKFDFDEDVATHAKRCVVTITRPNGLSRTYVSSSAWEKKYDAKASACSVAIENGAIEFIQAGENAGSVDPTTPGVLSLPSETDESVKTIEKCCLEVTAGTVKPHWRIINEPKFGRTQGCALRVRFNVKEYRVYSANVIYSSPSEAMKACAEAALAEGVLDFIKTWSTAAGSPPEDPQPPTIITLQQFFESLPQPLPETLPSKVASEINGPAWLNGLIQSARGGKIVPNFVWTADPVLGFHGCLLRLERPGEVKSYLVDPRFSKRTEAKAAVCLLAMWEGVGAHIRSIAKAIEDKIPPQARKHANEVLAPTLNTEYRKVRGPGVPPTIEHDQDLDACGATLVVELEANPDPSSSAQLVRRYSVPAEYRNRADAKLAVIIKAVDEGVIDFLRLRGAPPPPGY
ncbi:uncharacterized protein BXZ73DRAFT_23966, partial [Epithele typhae]|uniref:uncharacterized protein n=1 Tax=Epithele typhae TaxID=378194 RepID=UPI00200789E2